MTPVRLSLIVPALLAICVWAVVLIGGRKKRDDDTPTSRASAMCVYVSVSVALLGALIQEGITARYGAPGFLSGLLSDDAAHALGSVAYLAIFGSAGVAVLVRIVSASQRSTYGLHFYLWLPYLAAWAVGTALGRYPGALTSAWASLAVLMPIALLPAGPARRGVLVTARVYLRLIVGVSLILGLLYAHRTWAPYAVWPGGWRADLPRLQGFLPQPNVLGWLAAFAILLEFRGQKSRAGYVFAGLAAVVLVLSGSRSPLIALVLALALTAPRSSGRYSLPTGVRRLLVVVAGGLLVYQVLEANNLDSVGGRFVTWSNAWNVFLDNPLTGSGPGAYLRDLGTQVAVAYAHNQVLQTAAELGVLGIAALVVHIVVLVPLVRAAPRRALMASATAFWLVMFVPETLLRFTSLTFVLPSLGFGLLVHVALQSPMPASASAKARLDDHQLRYVRARRRSIARAGYG